MSKKWYLFRLDVLEEISFFCRVPCASVSGVDGRKFISIFCHICSIECNKCSRTSSLDLCLSIAAHMLWRQTCLRAVRAPKMSSPRKHTNTNTMDIARSLGKMELQLVETGWTSLTQVRVIGTSANWSLHRTVSSNRLWSVWPEEKESNRGSW